MYKQITGFFIILSVLFFGCGYDKSEKKSIRSAVQSIVGPLPVTYESNREKDEKLSELSSTGNWKNATGSILFPPQNYFNALSSQDGWLIKIGSPGRASISYFTANSQFMEIAEDCQTRAYPPGNNLFRYAYEEIGNLPTLLTVDCEWSRRDENLGYDDLLNGTF